MFHGKGNGACGSRSLLYSEENIHSEYFPSTWFIMYDELGSGCKPVFPVLILLLSSVKFLLVTYSMSDITPMPQQRDFAKPVSVSLNVAVDFLIVHFLYAHSLLSFKTVFLKATNLTKGQPSRTLLTAGSSQQMLLQLLGKICTLNLLIPPIRFAISGIWYNNLTGAYQYIYPMYKIVNL